MNKPRVSKKYMERVHPYIPEVYEQLKTGRVSRREFLRMATLLGMSLGAATIAAQCGAPAPAQPAEAPASSGGEAPAAATEEAAAAAPTEAPAAAAATGAIKRGGTLKVAISVPAVDHPARFSWVFDSNEFRLVFEYLTETDKDNITHPYLLESWKASEDLKKWTLNLRKGIKWTNGDEFTSEDVVYNLKSGSTPMSARPFWACGKVS
jgi:peptide/nickel transport system substrate-binding protein